MLYIIGLGLNEKGISVEGLKIAKICKKIYLENYTVEFPYKIEELQKVLGKRIIPADRYIVESFDILKDAKKEDAALLVYGSPLTATTHIALIQEAKKNKIKCEVIYSGSVIDAVAETGLQLYKFGKITSMPKWEPNKNFTPQSFTDIVKENLSVGAHTLILIDIGLDFQDAIRQISLSLKNNSINVDKILACSKLGSKEKKIIYKTPEELRKKNLKSPFCFIIPGKLHFMEEEVLKGF